MSPEGTATPNEVKLRVNEYCTFKSSQQFKRAVQVATLNDLEVT